MWYVIKEDELYHHGIKGQKWGVRRFQNPDGTLTAKGRKRYNVDIEGARKRYDDANIKLNSVLSKHGYSTEYDRALKEATFAKEDLGAERIKEKLNAQKTESKSFQKLKAEYQKKGMSEDEAAVAAYKRQRAEKIFAAAAITAASAAIAYAMYRHFDRNVDQIIPEGALLQRVAGEPDLAVRDAFYAAQSKGDADTYVGMYGQQILQGKVMNGEPGEVYQKQIRANRDIKIASEKSAKNALAAVASDSDKKALKNLMDEYASQIVPGVNATPRQYKVIQKARMSLLRGKVDSHVYEALNFARSGGGDDSIKPLLQKFDSELKNRGYGGIMDINDKRLSGYNTKSATIIIDSGKVSVESARQLSVSEMKTKLAKRYPVAMGKELFKEYSGVTVAGLFGVAGASFISNRKVSKRNDQIVEQYRKDHPNTKLSYTEIVRNYERTNRS